jgi:hypothetical protein
MLRQVTQPPHIAGPLGVIVGASDKKTDSKRQTLNR